MNDHQGCRLVSAIRAGDIETVKSLLDLYGQPDTKLHAQCYHFLCESLRSEKKDIAKLLLERGAEVNESKNGFKTPLHHAAEKGFDEVVSTLLEKDALVDAKDNHNETSLHRAVERGNPKIVELLLSKIPDVEAKTKDDLTPLHLALRILAQAKNLKDSSNRMPPARPTRCKRCRPDAGYIVQRPIGMMDTTDATKTETSHEEVVKLLLDHGADVDARNNDGKTVLEVAVRQCNFRIIESILLSRPAVKDKGNEHCLSVAVKMAGPEDTGVVELLVRYGFTLKSHDAKDAALLHNAVRNGYTKIVDHLLKLGAYTEVKHKMANGGTLLHSAAARGQTGIAELLVRHGANVNAKDEMGKTPILYAVENMDPDMTKLFLTNGANAEGKPSLLHTAADAGCSHIMKMILEKMSSIDVNAVDEVAPVYAGVMEMNKGVLSGGYNHFDLIERTLKLTALHVAVAKESARVVEILLEHKANPGFLAEMVGTPLHCSVLQRDPAIVEMLLLKGAEVDAKRGDGKTPLHLAIREGNTKAFEVLIKYGADVHERNNEGLNLVHVAAERGHLKMFEEHLLDVIKAGHPQDNRRMTALHYAVQEDCLADVEILLRYGADARVEDEDGRTPLHHATWNVNERILEALLNRFDPIDTRDINGETVLLKAANEGNLVAVRLLLFHRYDVNIKDKFGRRLLDILSRETHYFRYRDSFNDNLDADEEDMENMEEMESVDDMEYMEGMEDICSTGSCGHCFVCSQQQIAGKEREAEMIKQHIVKIMALGPYVNRYNRSFIDVSSLYKGIYYRCKVEVERMKRTNIGESNISFYEFLTKRKHQLAVYLRNASIAEILERHDYTNTFKLYSYMIDLRFRKMKIIFDLMDPSAISLSALSGYSLSGDNYLEIFSYQDRVDLENVIKAGASDDNDS